MKNTFSKLIALLLVISMLLLPGCGAKTPSTPETTVPATTAKPTNPPVTDPPGTTAPPTTALVRPTVDIVVNEAELTYTLTEDDVTTFYTALTESEDASINSTDAAVVEEKSELLNEKFAFLKAQRSIATVLYYSDMTDEISKQRFLDITDIVTQAYNDYRMAARRVYLSDSPHKDILFEGWTEEDFKLLMAYTEEVMEIQQRNAEIEVAYQDLQGSPTMYNKMVPLYIEMVQNYNRIAQIYGYDNFYDYAYEMEYLRDYDHEKIEAMRSYVSQYLVPALEGAKNKFDTSMAKLSMRSQQSLISFLYDSYTTNGKPYVNYYLASLPEQMQSDMLNMFNGNIVMKEGVNGAEEGAFTTVIGEDRPICYFGPGYSSATTIIHEVGHYYGAMHAYLDDIPLDLAETQSQGNEMLFLSFIKPDMSTNIYNTLINYRMYSDLAQILICILVDEFEEKVYTHENIANLTSDDLDAIMEDVCENYGGLSFVASYATNIQSYWRNVVIEQPVYYISYAVSALAAMDLFTIAQANYNDAVEIYRALNEEVDLEKGFLGNINAAGIPGPFVENVYKSLYDMFAQ